jgi:hypothetical protein
MKRYSEPNYQYNCHGSRLYYYMMYQSHINDPVGWSSRHPNCQLLSMFLQSYRNKAGLMSISSDALDKSRATSRGSENSQYGGSLCMKIYPIKSGLSVIVPLLPISAGCVIAWEAEANSKYAERNNARGSICAIANGV